MVCNKFVKHCIYCSNWKYHCEVCKCLLRVARLHCSNDCLVVLSLVRGQLSSSTRSQNSSICCLNCQIVFSHNGFLNVLRKVGECLSKIFLIAIFYCLVKSLENCSFFC